MNLCTKSLSTVLMSLASMAAPAFAQAPLGSGFTYQGRLLSAGAPVETPVDLRFKLYDAAAGGTQIGSTLTVNSMNIVNGLFTATLDFGPDAFNGDVRFLEIGLRSPAGSGTFITLSPRQALRAAPYALKVPGVDGHSLDAADGSHIDALFVDNAGNVGIGTTSPLRRFTVFHGDLFTARFANDHPTAAVAEVHSASSDSTWEFAVAGAQPPFGLAPGDLYLYNQGQPRPALNIDDQGYIGIGTADPFHPLHVRSTWNSAILCESESGNGILVNTSGFSGAAISAANSSASGQAFGLLASTTSSGGRAVHAIANASEGNSIAVSGWCNSSDGYDFFAGGAGINYGSSSSRRWKHNLATIDDPLGMLSRMRGVYFDWDTEHGGHHDIGMIAEEVGAILPEVVAYEANGIDASGMDYAKLTPLLVEAIKAQQNQIERLEQVNAEFRNHLARQQVENAELHKQLANLAALIQAHAHTAGESH